VTGETVAVQGAAPAGDLTTLTLAAPLTRLYDRSTVTVNANAVLATHGETVQEILGSGDAANPALTFTLRQAPLTYLTVPAGSGAQSTLQVWVNNLRWQEAPTLLAAGPADRVYTTRVNAAGNTVVQFGDGTHGARPPTGQANIRAVYRKGTGLAGMVRAGQLSQPLDRPQGLSAVTNPGAASLGADPATADEVRASAPLPTLTISRVVSLQDYQDYALGFAGIALAQATWTWTGGLRGIMVTVAGTGGSVLSPADPVVASLLTALRTSGDPNLPLTVAAHRPALFTFAAAVAVDSASFDPAAVRAQAWQAVSAVFAFGRRSLGQGVAASEVIAVIQAVPGVTAVRLTGLRRSGQPPAGAAVLRASGPQPPAGTQPAAGAELLVLDPATQGQIGAWQ
jgi:predicted phage baseplate assembly protein